MEKTSKKTVVNSIISKDLLLVVYCDVKTGETYFEEIPVKGFDSVTALKTGVEAQLKEKKIVIGKQAMVYVWEESIEKYNEKKNEYIKKLKEIAINLAGLYPTPKIDEKLEENKQVKNLKAHSGINTIVAVITGAAIVVGGAFAINELKSQYVKNNSGTDTKNSDTMKPTESSKDETIATTINDETIAPTIKIEVPEDARIDDLKQAYAAGNLNFDITDANVIQSKMDYLNNQFSNSDLSSAEIFDFFLTVNNMKTEGTDINQLENTIRRVQYAIAMDPDVKLDANEYIADKNDAAFISIITEPLFAYKDAVVSGNVTDIKSAATEFFATITYGIQFKQPMQRENIDVTQHYYEELSAGQKAYISGLVAMAINQPANDNIKDFNIFDSLEYIVLPGLTDNDKIMLVDISTYHAGPFIIAPGEKQSTDTPGGEEGLAQQEMTTFIGEYPNFINCPEIGTAKILS